MFLYELAIELGKHSNELAQAATDQGMVGVGPATMLDAAQVAALRAQFGSVTVGSPAPLPPPRVGAGGVPGPGPTTGPVGPVAPASWGPPPGASTPQPAAAHLPPPSPMRPSQPLVPPTSAQAPTAGVPASDEPDEPGWSSVQIAVVAAVVLAVVGLFGFMALNSGPSQQQTQPVHQAHVTGSFDQSIGQHR